MKTLISISKLLLLFIIILYSNRAISQWSYTQTEILSNATGRVLNITNPHTNSSQQIFTGLFNGTVDGNPTQFYSVKFINNFNLPDTSYTDVTDHSGLITPSIVYILNNYYPYKVNYINRLDNLNDESASVQLAIWKITDNVNINSSDNILIKNRAQSIISDVALNSGNNFMPVTVEVVNDIEPEFFYIKTTDENGIGISVNNIELELLQSPGYLSTYTVNTFEGISPSVEVINSGVGLIKVKGNFMFPQGMIFNGNNGGPELFLAKPVIGKMQTDYDWGTLPVELASFSSSISGNNVNLNWTTSSEINNAGFDVERSNVKSQTTNEWMKIGYVKGNGSVSTLQNYIFTDRFLNSGKYKYRLKQIDFNGNFEYFNLNSDVEIGTPTEFSLSQNYPNPFNPGTKINYELRITRSAEAEASRANYVSLKVFDILGNEIATLVNENKPAGIYSVNFDGSNLPSGIYFYKLQTGNFSKVMKMTLIK